MDKPSLYVETSIVSYLVTRPSRDLLTAACQQVTAQWWEDRRQYYDLCTSALVVAEAGAGNPDAATKRLKFLEGTLVLEVTDKAQRLAASLVARGALPEKAQADALHIAVAAVHGMDYLLTWNCRHIDNPSTKPVVRALCEKQGYLCPEICTPVEMMEIDPYVE